MPPTDPRRLVRLIHRVTAGSLVAAAVGAGVVTVHLAGHHARRLAHAAAADVRRPASGATPGTAPATTSARNPVTSRAATRRAKTTPSRAPKPTRTFRNVAPVQPSVKQPQATSTGS